MSSDDEQVPAGSDPKKVRPTAAEYYPRLFIGVHPVQKIPIYGYIPNEGQKEEKWIFTRRQLGPAGTGQRNQSIANLQVDFERNKCYDGDIQAEITRRGARSRVRGLNTGPTILTILKEFYKKSPKFDASAPVFDATSQNSLASKRDRVASPGKASKRAKVLSSQDGDGDLIDWASNESKERVDSGDIKFIQRLVSQLHHEQQVKLSEKMVRMANKLALRLPGVSPLETTFGRALLLRLTGQAGGPPSDYHHRYRLLGASASYDVEEDGVRHANEQDFTNTTTGDSQPDVRDVSTADLPWQGGIGPVLKQEDQEDIVYEQFSVGHGFSLRKYKRSQLLADGDDEEEEEEEDYEEEEEEDDEEEEEEDEENNSQLRGFLEEEEMHQDGKPFILPEAVSELSDAEDDANIEFGGITPSATIGADETRIPGQEETVTAKSNPEGEETNAKLESTTTLKAPSLSDDAEASPGPISEMASPGGWLEGISEENFFG